MNPTSATCTGSPGGAFGSWRMGVDDPSPAGCSRSERVSVDVPESSGASEEQAPATIARPTRAVRVLNRITIPG